MALLVNNAKFVNTEVTAPEVYVRLQYTSLADGKKVSARLMTGLDKEAAMSFKAVPVNFPDTVLVEVAEGANQDLAAVHAAVKANLEALELGLEVTVQL